MNKSNTQSRRPSRKNQRSIGTFIIASIAYIILGIFMIIHPDETGKAIPIVFGIILAIYGVINIISFFLNNDSDENLFLELIIGVFAAAFGIFSLIMPDVILSILFKAIGAVVIVDGIMNLKRAFTLRTYGMKRWWIFLIVSALAVITGLLFIVFVHELIAVWFTLMGVILVYEGLSGLVILFAVSRFKKKSEKQLAVIDVDYEDK